MRRESPATPTWRRCLRWNTPWRSTRTRARLIHTPTLGTVYVIKIMTVTPSTGDRSATGKVKSSFINTTQCPTDLTSSTPPTLPNWPVSWVNLYQQTSLDYWERMFCSSRCLSYISVCVFFLRWPIKTTEKLQVTTTVQFWTDLTFNTLKRFPNWPAR